MMDKNRTEIDVKLTKVSLVNTVTISNTPTFKQILLNCYVLPIKWQWNYKF